MSAFIDLMLSEGYEAITVERVVEKANVGRSTFYVHFKSKEDILRQAISRPSSILSIIVGHDLKPDVLAPQMQHFQDQRQRNRVFFVAPVRSLWVSTLADMIEPRLAHVARIARARPILPLPLIAQMLAENQIALISNWLMGKSASKPQAVAEAMIASTHAMLAVLLGCPPGTPLFIPGERLRVLQKS